MDSVDSRKVFASLLKSQTYCVQYALLPGMYIQNCSLYCYTKYRRFTTSSEITGMFSVSQTAQSVKN